MSLCFITCNIRFDNPADGDNTWSLRRDFLVKSLLHHQPVVIATQEGRYHQLQDLNHQLNRFQIIDHHRSWIGERMYPSIFLKEGVFEFLSSGDRWLSETPEVAGSSSFESSFPRLMTWVKVQLKNSKQNFLIVNTHLDHVKQQTRLEQMRVLISEVKRLWDQHSSLIIMGDFNDSPESEVRKLIEQDLPCLQDAWKLFNHHEETSHHAFRGELENGNRIDWILTDQRLSLQNCLMDKSNIHGRYPTDHFPIICHFKI